MEPPFWHIYVIMAAKIIFKLDLSLTVRVSAHCFGVTSHCLCDTFPKFGDLFSHRAFGHVNHDDIDTTLNQTVSLWCTRTSDIKVFKQIAVRLCQPGDSKTVGVVSDMASNLLCSVAGCMCLADCHRLGGYSRYYFLGCETTSCLNIDSGTTHMRYILGSRERWEFWIFLNATDSPLALPKRQASATVMVVQGCKRAYHPAEAHLGRKSRSPGIHYGRWSSVIVTNDVQSSSPVLFSPHHQYCSVLVANDVHSLPILFIPRRQKFSVPVANDVHSSSSVMFSLRRQCPPRQWSRIWSLVSCALLCNARHWKKTRGNYIMQCYS